MLTGLCPYEPLSNQMEVSSLPHIQSLSSHSPSIVCSQIAVAVMHKKARPVIPPNCPPKIVALLQVSLLGSLCANIAQVCWSENPSARPGAAQILESLDSVIPQNYLS
jgi:hypothetical protein